MIFNKTSEVEENLGGLKEALNDYEN